MIFKAFFRESEQIVSFGQIVDQIALQVQSTDAAHIQTWRYYVPIREPFSLHLSFAFSEEEIGLIINGFRKLFSFEFSSGIQIHHYC